MTATTDGLTHTLARALELAMAGKPYAEVIAHLGTMAEHHHDYLMSGEHDGTLESASPLFGEIHFRLDGPGTAPGSRVVAMEFLPVPGSFTLHELRAVFGESHRSPPEPEQASYALAWFARFDARSGAAFSLYAEYADYQAAINPDLTPDRVFFQPQDARWD